MVLADGVYLNQPFFPTSSVRHAEAFPNLPSDELDFETLSGVIGDPATMRSLDMESRIKLYRSLRDIECYLLRTLTLAHIITTAEDGAEVESVNKFLELEQGARLIRHLSQLFPEFGDFELAGSDTVQQQAESALRRIYELRFSLLFANDEQE